MLWVELVKRWFGGGGGGGGGKGENSVSLTGMFKQWPQLCWVNGQSETERDIGTAIVEKETLASVRVTLSLYD